MHVTEEETEVQGRGDTISPRTLASSLRACPRPALRADGGDGEGQAADGEVAVREPSVGRGTPGPGPWADARAGLRKLSGTERRELPLPLSLWLAREHGGDKGWLAVQKRVRP